ncbi:M20 family metallopeptidase [Pannonibacter carbonis]|uniref:M20 family metallopeptidase n=1 Tax=Pannonibacter carbonis TaxID=2067569 RepID=UPI000D0FC7BC|nr:M20/M25/M40 family metallo-hydrolase [Pannonibacter carbonis]
MTDVAALAERLRAALDSDQVIALLRGAVACNSITGNEASMVAYLKPEMQRLGLAPQTADFQPGRPNIWGERKGTGTGPRLLFMGHTDTVHVKGWAEKWAGTERENPFGGALVDGEIWGRGTGDLKAGICTSLAALDLLDRAGIKLAGDVAYAFVGDEESGEEGTGVSAGVNAYTRLVETGDVARPDFAVYVEPTQLNVLTAQMGFFIADLTLTGRSAYFGVPEQGIDALKAAHRLQTALFAHSDAIAIRSEHPLVGRAFLLITHLEAGGYIAVPGTCRLSLIRKLLPGESLDTAVAEFEAAARGSLTGTTVHLDIRYPAGRDHAFGGSPAEIDPEHPAALLMSAAIGAEMQGKGAIAGAPYWSESPFLINRLSCPAIYCAPGDISNCHTLEERVNVADYLSGIVAFASFIAAYCGVQGT